MVEPGDGGNPVRNFRILRGWTQEIAAEWWGTSARNWRRWESKPYPPLALLKRIREWAQRSCPENLHYLS